MEMEYDGYPVFVTCKLKIQHKNDLISKGLYETTIDSLSNSILKGPKVFFELERDSNYGESFIRVS